jgi:hypothetical protein
MPASATGHDFAENEPDLVLNEILGILETAGSENYAPNGLVHIPRCDPSISAEIEWGSTPSGASSGDSS